MVKIYNIQVDTRSEVFYTSTINYRLNILEKSIAMLNNDIGDSEEILGGIILAPENTFARNCTGNTVRQFDVEQKNSILASLAQLSSKYPNILIIPGTIFWKEHVSLEYLNTEASQRTNLSLQAKKDVLHSESQEKVERVEDYKVSKDPQQLNNAPTADTQASGANHDRKQSMVSTKKSKFLPTLAKLIGSLKLKESNVEISYNVAYLYLGGLQIGEYYKKIDLVDNLKDNDKCFQATKDGPSIFAIPNGNGKFINLGIEIGFEHRWFNYLKNSMKTRVHSNDAITQHEKDNLLDIHLVLTSESLGPNAESICIREGGQFVLSSSYKKRSIGATRNLTPNDIIMGYNTQRPRLEGSQEATHASRISAERSQDKSQEKEPDEGHGK